MNLPGYDIDDTVATSARSIVHRAIRRNDGQSVIVKSLAQDYPSPHELRQLEFEFRILRKLDVPGVIRAVEFVKNGNDAALVIEDFGGKTIPVGPRGTGLALFFNVAIQVATTLGRIHERNVIHKDIKPRNLLMNPHTQEVKVIDFTVASELSRERQDINAANLLQGSLPYISPEQTGRMNRELDYRTDYYSLGVTFFELLTGHLPFSAHDAMGWIHCHISKRAPLASQINPEVPAVVAQIVAKLMAKDPDDRYQSSHGLVADLRKCQEQWKSERTIEPFTLGAEDVSERFRISSKLFGREREIKTMLEVFEEASDGQAKLLLISGYSGVGKSSLIDEVQKPIDKRNGYFVSGKFDQLERNIPYSALVRAFRQLVKHLLAESDERLAGWKSRLSRALGANGQMMVDLIPELGQIIVPQPALPDLDPSEAQNRFRNAFHELIKTFAQPDHPLVVFLDDLHWMDASTPGLLTDLFASPDVGHLLLIGAYRDNEVHEEHVLSSVLRTLRTEHESAVRELSLKPLGAEAVNQLIADTLRCSEEATRPFTELIFDKTEGNPFFTTELLASLHREGAFTFRAAEGRWDWDAEKVRSTAISESAADLLAQRLRRLPDDVLRILQVAACTGSRFELRALARITEQRTGAVADALWEAIVQGVVIPLDENYRLVATDDVDVHEHDFGARYQFQHDRVQQAAYSLIDPKERAALHCKIGRWLLAASSDAEQDQRIFDIVNHLDFGQDFAGDPKERTLLARLNAKAGSKAKRSAAYAAAARYFDKSVELLAAGLEFTPRERFEIHREHTECVFLAGEIERAKSLCSQVYELAPSLVDRGAVYCLKARIFEHQGGLLDSIAAIREGLALFGVMLPEDRKEIERRIGEGIGKMQAHLAKVPVEELANLPEMNDPEKAMTMELLFQVIAPAIQTYPPLFVLVELLMFDLTLTHGTTVISCKNFVDCGIIQGGMLGNYDVAYRLGQTAFKLLKRYEPSPLESAVYFVFASFISHWRAHHREGFESLNRTLALAHESGNIQYAAYACNHRLHRMILTGRPLSDCEAEYQSGLAYLSRLHATGQLIGMAVASRPLSRLLARDADPDAMQRADDDAIAAIKKINNAQWFFAFGQYQTMVSFILGEIEAAEKWQRFTEPFTMAGSTLFPVPDFHLFNGLLLLRKARALPEAERAAALEAVKKIQAKLKIWNDNCADNFAHKYNLLSAELARVTGAPLEDVLRLYEDAASSSGDAFIHLRALANELQADFWLERGRAKIARTLMREAHQLYAQWGAVAKLRQLEGRHPDWFAPAERAESGSTTQGISPTATGATVSFDLGSVLKATQAISSEVKTERLFAALMGTIIENAGAQRGCLILKDDSDQSLRVEASANVDEPPAAEGGARSTPLESAPNVCADIVRYVMRTREILVLDDAAHDGGFQSDPYVRENAIKSVLCMPILNQGNLVAVLYAENNATTRAFTKERLDILRTIASQVAISITNAQLYNNLERKVEQRTLELAQKNREIGVMLDGMDQGIFTINSDLVIQPQYSKHLEQILGTSNIAGQPCLEMLFRDADIRPDTLSAMAAALRFSFGVLSILAEANMHLLVRAFQRLEPGGQPRHFEVDWNFILDEREEVGSILVAVREVTLLKQLEETAAQKAREMDIVGQVLEAGLGPFREICESSRRLVDESRSVVVGSATLGPSDIQHLFRNLHTIKGNARLLGFTHLVDTVHAAEDAYEALRQDPQATVDRPKLLLGLESVARAIGEYYDICHRKLGPLSQGHDAKLDRALREIEDLVDGGNTSDAADIVQKIRGSLARLRAVSLAELVKDTSRMFPSLALELKKSIPYVDYEDDGTALNVEWAQVMKDVLVQSFRNSLAHGIESVEERKAESKSAQGRIRVRWERDAHGLHVRLSDDGTGLALDLLRERTGRAAGSDEEIAEAIFAAGVSTSASISRISGRGVGMDVVRSSVRKKGGDVGVVFTGEWKDGHRPFELLISLPLTALANESTANAGADSAVIRCAS